MPTTYLTLFDGVTGRALWLGRNQTGSPTADQRIVLHAKDRAAPRRAARCPATPPRSTTPLPTGPMAARPTSTTSPSPASYTTFSSETGGWTTRKLPNGDNRMDPTRTPAIPAATNTYHHPERLLPTEEPLRRSEMNSRPRALVGGMTFTLTDDSALLKPLGLGAGTAANRIFMAPLTRGRAGADGTPSDLQVEYYAQRASAGLIITEATAVSPAGNGAYAKTPGYLHRGTSAEVSGGR